MEKQKTEVLFDKIIRRKKKIMKVEFFGPELTELEMGS
jgi:hypothetical protein